jgi:hypothetical protein
MTRQAYVHEAVLALDENEDPRRPGAVVTVELCGHWEHEGPCRWPHHTSATSADDELVVRTTLACEPSEREEVVGRVASALRSADGWRVLRAAEVSPTDDERARAERWYDMPRP